MKKIAAAIAFVILAATAIFAIDRFALENTGEVGESGPEQLAAGNEAALQKAKFDPVKSEPPAGLLYIIYDSSNSMWGELSDGSRKYEAGRNALEALLASPIDREYLAFRAYGHRRPGDCRDSELMVPIGKIKTMPSKIGEAVSAIRPTGKTPISHSLREGLKDFGDRDGDILLISDGIETCDIDPCALMEEWRREGVKIRVHVVGVGLNELERKAMACVADIGGGKYFDAGSEAELANAINTVSALPASDPNKPDKKGYYALQITGTDDQGRAFIVEGSLLRDGKRIKTVSSVGLNPVETPGDYVVRAGVRLADGTIYKPVRKKVRIAEPGTTVLNLDVTRPAIVNARFAEDGEAHRGDFVTAYQKGKKIFGFRAFDEALARPGSYEFRSNPNQDNDLKVQAQLVEGQTKTINFDLQKTVKFTIRFRQPDGKLVKRHSNLSRGGKKIYFVHASNGGRAVPGTYRLTMDNRKNPLTKPVDVTIRTEGQEIIVDLPAAFLTVNYTGSPDNFLGKPDRVFVRRFDEAAGKYARHSSYTRVDTSVAFSPGRYRVEPFDRTGYFDPVTVTLASGDSKTVKLPAKPLGKVVLRYDPAATFRRKPDRAFIKPLDGQRLVGCNCRLNTPHKVPPGRYSARAWYAAGDFADQTITVRAGRTTTVTLSNK